MIYLALPLSLVAASQTAAVSIEQDGIWASLDLRENEAVVSWRFSKFLPDSMKLSEVDASTGGMPLGNPTLQSYPQAGDRTSIAFLLDVTGPERASQIDLDKISMFQLIGKAKPYHQASMILYSDRPQLLVVENGNVGSLINLVAGARPRLVPTNLNRALQATIEALSREEVSRRVIFVLSDGHSDDALDIPNLVTSARKNNVILMFLVSRSERPVDLPSLALLAQSTGGQLIGMEHLPALVENPFALIDSGATARFPLQGLRQYFWQSSPIVRVVFRYGTREAVLTAPASLPIAGPIETARYLGANHPVIAGSSALAVVALAAGSVFLLRRRRAATAEDPAPARPTDLSERKTVYAVLQNIDDGSSHAISSALVTLGRAGGNDIVISDKAVSREHAVIRRGDDGVFVVENKGSNGTTVNHLEVEQAELSDGDLITIGDTTLRFVRTKA